MTDFTEVEVKSRADLRAWLDANSASHPSVWLVTYKKHTDHYLDYGALIDHSRKTAAVTASRRAGE